MNNTKLLLLAINSDPKKRIVCCRHPKVTAELLIQLSNDEDEYVRQAVASNAISPSHILVKLSKDAIDIVRRAVCVNTNTPSYILEILSNDENQWIQQGVALNVKHSSTCPNLPFKE